MPLCSGCCSQEIAIRVLIIAQIWGWMDASVEQIQAPGLSLMSLQSLQKQKLSSVHAGKSFFKKKKQPIPVDLTSKDWAGQVRKATEATYMHHTGGTCINIRCAAASCSCVGNRGQGPLLSANGGCF